MFLVIMLGPGLLVGTSGPVPDVPWEPEEEGICINCGDKMDYSPMHPWCPKCSDE